MDLDAPPMEEYLICAPLRVPVEFAEPLDGFALDELAARDPNDVAVLAAAIAGRCDVLVTGDGDLLALRERHPAIRGVKILTPREFGDWVQGEGA
jgi:hypothetical protein